jgi:hypothetical protein
MEPKEHAEDQFWRLFKAIRRKDIALAYSYTGMIVSAMVLFAIDLLALSLVYTRQYLEIGATLVINAILGSLFLILLICLRRGVPKLKRMVNDARALVQSTGMAIPSDLSVGPDGIVYSGFLGRKKTYRWDEIEAVVYDDGSIDFRMKNKRIVRGHPTNYWGLDYDLKAVAMAIVKNLPEDRWTGAREWLDSQQKGTAQKPLL